MATGVVQAETIFDALANRTDQLLVDAEKKEGELCVAVSIMRSLKYFIAAGNARAN